jgi:LasA protease
MRFRFVIAIVLLSLAACSTPSSQLADDPTPTPATTKIFVTATAIPATPTPFSTLVIERYTVRAGDTLGAISLRYDMSVEDLMKLNGLANPNTLFAGQQIKVTFAVTRAAPADKLIPDSEAVYSPAYEKFDVASFASQYNGYLTAYREKVDGEQLTGPQIVQLVAERFSVGPRVLLALLEFQSGWVTNANPSQTDYPMGLIDKSRAGLFFQTSWAANHLNEGYYGKLNGQLSALKFKDNKRARVHSSANAGTVAIQNVLALATTWDIWQMQIGTDGMIATYRKLFGDPNQYAIEPLIPPGLQQPLLRLPWNNGEMWYFTGGPHAGWGDGSGWAALDFSPRDTPGSCYTSRMWTTAAAPGKIIRAEHGRVVESLTNSDFQGVGWALLYMHQATTGRIAPGTSVNTGDHIGHPSCEGGNAEASHVHLARLYNGQWIDPSVTPYVISGWQIAAQDIEYNGKMVRGGETREACNCRDDIKNGIVADTK